MNMHPSEQSLHDYLDNELDTAAAAAVARHVNECADCGAQVERLQRLQRQLRTLPAEMAPPADALAAIHRRIASGDTGPLDELRELRNSIGDGEVRHAERRLWWQRRGMLAAAALLLVALSSAITAIIVLRYRPAPGFVQTDDMSAQPTTQLVALDIMETSYIDTIEELQRILREQEHVLAPETVRLIQSNLDVIDRALAEARAALSEDPANAVLVDLLRASYERKIDVLRSARDYAATRL